ncbi:hypothetical protein [Akkermansia muciniphila]|jgi:uncharacterized protein (DUF2132 family)|uniref:hypothetical protein n=1 Tax=Akkermansia muciniphila TaxID=239935 RepID=UPI0011AF786B|nr:hypothetical protein [Akkermansia muciniphila]
MGEESLFSGIQGESIFDRLSTVIGWDKQLKNITIKCLNKHHISINSGQKRTHGDDSVYVTRNPYIPDQIEVVHIQVKHTKNKYPAKQTLINKFKSYISELHDIIECAQYSQEIEGIIDSIPKAETNRVIHRGVLAWFCSSDPNCPSIIPELLKLEYPHNKKGIALLDNSRANFLYDIIRYMNIHSQDDLFTQWSYYHPSMNLSCIQKESRTSTELPIFSLTSGMISMKVIKNVNNSEGLYLFSPEPFSRENLLRCLHCGFSLLSGWGKFLRIGFSDFNGNDSAHQKIEQTALTAYKKEYEVMPFTYKPNIITSTDV